MMSRKSGKNIIVGRENFRTIKISDPLISNCNFCNKEGTKYETDQGIVACINCGAEDQNHVPFFSENDFLREAYKAQIARFGAIESTEEPTQIFT